MDIDKENFYQYINDKISHFVKLKNVKMVDTAEAIGISKSTLANIIAGRQQISLHLLFLLANHLKVDILAFIPPSDFFIKSNLFDLDYANRLISENSISEPDRKRIFNLLNNE